MEIRPLFRPVGTQDGALFGATNIAPGEGLSECLLESQLRYIAQLSR